MKFTMQSFALVGGVSTLAKSADLSAADDCAAVDAARAAHDKIVPDVGGDYEIVVTALEPGVHEMVRGQYGEYLPRPPGEICRFGVAHEPHESVREEVYAEREKQAAVKAAADLRESVRAEIVAELIAAAPELEKQITAAADATQAAEAKQ